jgi:response regulator RpfG family c-di-GMP phosphodiesterase
MDTINKIQDDNLLVLKTEYEKFMKSVREFAATAVVGNIDSPEAKAAAEGMLKGMKLPPPLPGQPEPTSAENLAKTKKILDESFAFVQTIIGKCKTTPSAKSFLEVLKEKKNNEDPIQCHCRHVSALSALGLMSLGNTSIEEITDIAFAGLIHDMGMEDIPSVLTEKHLKGVPVDNLNSSEKIALMRHIDFVFERLKKTKTFVPDGARRIIEQHHENFSGTGFKGVKGARIFRSARVLRIMDELVVHVQNPDDVRSLQQAIEVIKSAKELETNEPHFDPDILAVLEKTILGTK